MRTKVGRGGLKGWAGMRPVKEQEETRLRVVDPLCTPASAAARDGVLRQLVSGEHKCVPSPASGGASTLRPGWLQEGQTGRGWRTGQRSDGGDELRGLRPTWSPGRAPSGQKSLTTGPEGEQDVLRPSRSPSSPVSGLREQDV